jgi:transcriptional regulator with XRE-family HTH domain
LRCSSQAENLIVACVDRPVALPNFAHHLASLRSLLGLTQEDFAEKAGISYKYYQAIESGRRTDLRCSTLARLARAHGMRMSEFFLRMEAPAPALAAGSPVRYQAARRPKPTTKD